MADGYDKDNKAVVLDLRDNAIIPDAVAPQAAKFCPCQCGADTPRIVEICKPVGKKIHKPGL